MLKNKDCETEKRAKNNNSEVGLVTKKSGKMTYLVYDHDNNNNDLAKLAKNYQCPGMIYGRTDFPELFENYFELIILLSRFGCTF